MKKIKLHDIMAAIVICILTLMASGVSVSAADSAVTPAGTYVGSNVDSQNYLSWSKTVKSYLETADDGSYMRFQADALSDEYLVEYYDDNFHLSRTVTVSAELSVFGGFYNDGTYYYILSGQENSGFDDSVEVYRLTKYDHSWNRLGAAPLYGADTATPFYNGSCRFASDGNLLFVRSSHKMYNGHQANITIEYNTSTMKAVDYNGTMTNITTGYVSHSLNQFIKLDNGQIVGVDHGDSYPRAMVLTKTTVAYTASEFSKYSVVNKELLSISGAIGNNYTYASIGGFEISSDNYIVVGNTVPMGDAYGTSTTRNVFVAVQDRNLSSDPELIYMTAYTDSTYTCGTPQLVKLNDDLFMIMWMCGGQLNYRELDGSGNPVSLLYTANAALSDCVPIVRNNKLVWYTWNNDTETFYTIDLADLFSVTTTERMNGHDVAYGNADSSGNVSGSCSICGKTSTMSTMTVIHPSWWNNAGTTGYTSMPTPVYCNTSCKITVTRFLPADADNTDFVLESSNKNVAIVGGNKFYFLNAGTVTLTVYPRYNKAAAVSETVTVIHNPKDEGTVISEAACSKEGSIQYTCSNCRRVYTETIPKTDHTVVIDAGTAATCTEPGLTEGSHCSVCGEVIAAQTTIPAKGHTVVTDPAVPATTSATGLTEGSHCSVCGAVIKAQEVVPVIDANEVCRIFTDVAHGSWYEESVQYVYDYSLMTGLNATTFGPAKTLSRAQFAVILWRMTGSPAQTYVSKFPDVGKGTWYTDAVLWANSIGVVTGYQNGKFGPADTITREQMALMMYRYANACGYDRSTTASFEGFTDANRVSGFAKEAMQWAVGMKIITGRSDNTVLDPQGHASRAECATIIMRFMKAYT